MMMDGDNYDDCGDDYSKEDGRWVMNDGGDDDPVACNAPCRLSPVMRCSGPRGGAAWRLRRAGAGGEGCQGRPGPQRGSTQAHAGVWGVEVWGVVGGHTAMPGLQPRGVHHLTQVCVGCGGGLRTKFTWPGSLPWQLLTVNASSALCIWHPTAFLRIRSVRLYVCVSAQIYKFQDVSVRCALLLLCASVLKEQKRPAHLDILTHPHIHTLLFVCAGTRMCMHMLVRMPKDKLMQTPLPTHTSAGLCMLERLTCRDFTHFKCDIYTGLHAGAPDVP